MLANSLVRVFEASQATTVDPLGGLRTVVAGLRELAQDVDDAVRVDRLRAMEEAKSALAAAQAREAVAFAASQRTAQLAAGVPVQRAERGIAAQIGLALRCSPWQAQRYLGWARVLISELPATFAQLTSGRTTERRALTVARETVFLSQEDRASVDAELAPRLQAMGDRAVEAEAKRLAYRLDPVGFVARVRGAEADRRVTLRPAPDAIPAAVARALVLDANEKTPVWLRRLFTAPDSGRLVAMESTRRAFPAGQRRFIRLRDQVCRTPWCDAPVRHIDHVEPVLADGLTTIENGQGYCQACNHAKQAPGWNATVVTRAGPHEVEIRTPTGHVYNSRAPDPPRAA